MHCRFSSYFHTSLYSILGPTIKMLVCTTSRAVTVFKTETGFFPKPTEIEIAVFFLTRDEQFFYIWTMKSAIWLPGAGFMARHLYRGLKSTVSQWAVTPMNDC